MRPSFVLFGDSITEWSFTPGGWGAALTDRYARKADVVLRGFAGYNTRWALFLLNKIFPTNPPSKPPLLVTVFFGANDASLPDGLGKDLHVPIPEYQENLRKIIFHLQGICEATHVVLITPPPIHEESLRKSQRQWHGGDGEEPSSRTNEVAGMYAKACMNVAKEAGVAVIDLWTSIQEKACWQTSCLSDGLHLSPEGNAVVFEELIKILNDKGLDFENMEWDFPEFSKINADDPGKFF